MDPGLTVIWQSGVFAITFSSVFFKYPENHKNWDILIAFGCQTWVQFSISESKCDEQTGDTPFRYEAHTSLYQLTAAKIRSSTQRQPGSILFIYPASRPAMPYGHTDWYVELWWWGKDSWNAAQRRRLGNLAGQKSFSKITHAVVLRSKITHALKLRNNGSERTFDRLDWHNAS